MSSRRIPPEDLCEDTCAALLLFLRGDSTWMRRYWRKLETNETLKLVRARKHYHARKSSTNDRVADA